MKEYGKMVYQDSEILMWFWKACETLGGKYFRKQSGRFTWQKVVPSCKQGHLKTERLVETSRESNLS